MEKCMPFRIGFFIDGFTFHKVSDYYRHQHKAKSRLKVSGLKEFVLQRLQKYIPKQSYISLESHYYHPHENPIESDYQKSQGVLLFEEKLKSQGFQFHYRPKNAPQYTHGNIDLINDIRMLALFSEIQLAVLVSTQGFYIDTAKFLKEHNIPLVLVGWDFRYMAKDEREIHWKTDCALRESADEYLAIEHEIEFSKSTSIKNMFMNPWHIA